MFDAHDLQPRRGVRLGVAGRGDLAVLEIALGVADATHLQAFAQQRFEALANDELGTAATDVGHQALARGVGEGVGHAEIDQARFFTTGNDFHRVAENFFGATDEFGTVAGFTQGVGAHDSHGAGGHTADQLGEALEAIEPALHRFFVEMALFVDAGGQLNLLPETLENTDFAVLGLGHDHVKAVGAQVDCGDQGQILGLGLRHGRGSRSITSTSCHDQRLPPTRRSCRRLRSFTTGL
ncbi:hypothetical protein D3C73_730320 [compost metagenome]